jgi:hypothetical protein
MSSIGAIAVEPLDLVLTGVAVVAVDAQGILDDLLAVLAGEVLRHMLHLMKFSLRCKFAPQAKL